MSRCIFLSYRRADAALPSEIVRKHLIEVYGEGAVLQDRHSIPAGVDFREWIQDQLRRTSVVLVLIGENWSPTRLFDPDDVLRMELELALSSEIEVIPLLLGGAKMPERSQLPASVARLLHLNMAELRFGGPDLDTDLGRLVQAINQAQERRRIGHERAMIDDPWMWLNRAAAADARARLGAFLVGQPVALDAVGKWLDRIATEHRVSSPAGCPPRGVFLFAGLPGTGRRTLAAAIADVVLHDPKKVHVVDLRSARATVAASSWRQNVVNWSTTHKHGVVVFRHVEAASAETADALRHAITREDVTADDPLRASLVNSVVIFTTDLGADEMRRRLRSSSVAPAYPAVRDDIEAAVIDHMSTAQPSARLIQLLFNGLVVFDLLRASSIAPITQMMLGSLRTSLREEGFSVVVEQTGILELVRSEMAALGPSAGGNVIEAIVGQRLKDDVRSWIVSTNPRPGTRILVRTASATGTFDVGALPDV